jgi:hypothetical protein
VAIREIVCTNVVFVKLTLDSEESRFRERLILIPLFMRHLHVCRNKPSLVPHRRVTELSH